MLLKKLKYSSIGLQPYQRSIKELILSENLNKVQKFPVALNLNFPWKEERNKIFGYFQYKILTLIETNLKLTSNNNFIALFVVTGCIKKIFSNDYVNICLFSIFFQ